MLFILKIVTFSSSSSLSLSLFSLKVMCQHNTFSYNRFTGSEVIVGQRLTEILNIRCGLALDVGATVDGGENNALLYFFANKYYRIFSF